MEIPIFDLGVFQAINERIAITMLDFHLNKLDLNFIHVFVLYKYNFYKNLLNYFVKEFQHYNEVKIVINVCFSRFWD